MSKEESSASQVTTEEAEEFSQEKVEEKQGPKPVEPAEDDDLVSFC